MSVKAILQIKEFVLKDSPPGGNSHDYCIDKQPTKMEQRQLLIKGHFFTLF